MRDAAQRCLAVGFFDGVHLGHQAILKGADAVLTFCPHPLEVLDPGRAPLFIMSHEERLSALRATGVRSVTVLDFTPEFAQTEPADFIAYLRSVAGGSALVVRCGDNWRFGRGGKGDAGFLRAHGIDVEIVPYAELDGERISSSWIRRLLGEGNVRRANAMLGRCFSVTAPVRSGKGLGTGLGFPTLNLRPARPLPLKTGVYAVEVSGVRGVANFGLAPTMGERAWTEPVLEVHLLGDVVSRESSVAEVRFLEHLRDERRFDSLDDLKRRIAADCELAKHV